jgi:imidazolonepropionase
MPVLRNIATLATCARDGGQGEIHPITRAALAWERDRLTWVGPESELPERYRAAEALDAGGRLVIPGLVDCHTHLAFGGWRADEYEMRIRGLGYLEIAATGGGIMSTVKLTRACTEAELFARSAGFAEEVVRLGVTSIECKSGYGLTVEDEMKLLRVYRRLREQHRIRVVATLLGAHAVPPEYGDRRDEYLSLVVDHMIPLAAREHLAQFCDVFVEESAFTLDDARAILAAGRRAGLGAKLHADQLTSGGGAELAAELGAISADHLEFASDGGIECMASRGVVAVSLPVASLYLAQQPMRARRFINAGVPVAVATDFNPGSAPSYHLPFAMMLACTMQRMKPAEVLKGATLYAARAIGLEKLVGSLEPGKAADFALIDAPDVNQWLYNFRANACVMTASGGRIVWNCL